VVCLCTLATCWCAHSRPGPHKSVELPLYHRQLLGQHPPLLGLMPASTPPLPAMLSPHASNLCSERWSPLTHPYLLESNGSWFGALAPRSHTTHTTRHSFGCDNSQPSLSSALFQVSSRHWHTLLELGSRGAVWEIGQPWANRGLSYCALFRGDLAAKVICPGSLSPFGLFWGCGAAGLRAAGRSGAPGWAPFRPWTSWCGPLLPPPKFPGGATKSCLVPLCYTMIPRSAAHTARRKKAVGSLNRPQKTARWERARGDEVQRVRIEPQQLRVASPVASHATRTQ
jgi:hypothetical protein